MTRDRESEGHARPGGQPEHRRAGGITARPKFDGPTAPTRTGRGASEASERGRKGRADEREIKKEKNIGRQGDTFPFVAPNARVVFA